jgi:hypothetical protein
MLVLALIALGFPASVPAYAAEKPPYADLAEKCRLACSGGGALLCGENGPSVEIKTYAPPAEGMGVGCVKNGDKWEIKAFFEKDLKCSVERSTLVPENVKVLTSEGREVASSGLVCTCTFRGGKEGGSYGCTVGEASLPFCSMPLNIAEYRSTWHFCWFCEPFKKVVELIAGPKGLAKKAFANYGDKVTALIAAGFCIWLALYVFKLLNPISGVGVKNGWEMASPIGGMAFRAMLAAILIKTGGGGIYEFFVVPAIQLATAVALKLNYVSESASAGVNSADAFAAMNESLSAFFEQSAYIIMDIIANGVLLIRYSVSKSEKSGCFFPVASPFFSGVMLAVAGSVLVVQFPLKFINALLRLAFVCVLMPFIIAAWVFSGVASVFKGFVEQAFNMVANVCTTFMFAGLSVYICRRFIENFYQVKKDPSCVKDCEMMNMPFDNVDEMNRIFNVAPDQSGDLRLFLVLTALLLLIFLIGRIPLFGSAIASAAAGLAKGGARAAGMGIMNMPGMLEKTMDMGNSMSAAFSGVKEPEKNNLNEQALNLVKARVYKPAGKAAATLGNAVITNPRGTGRKIAARFGYAQSLASDTATDMSGSRHALARFLSKPMGLIIGAMGLASPKFIGAREEVYRNLDQRFANAKSLKSGVKNYMTESRHGVVRKTAKLGGWIAGLKEFFGNRKV